MSEAWIIEAVRSPIGRYRGALKDIRPDDLLAQVLRELVARTGLSSEVLGAELDDVLIGCANQAGEDNRNVARMGLLLAGLPERVPGVTVNRLCASGLEAVLMAARAIRAGEGGLFIAGGVESMTRAPLVMGKSEVAFPNGNVTVYDSSLGWRFPNPRLAQRFPLEAMGETAENLAERYRISRGEQDRFALQSHQRAVAAAGRLAGEIVPITVASGKASVTVSADEGPRADSTLDKLGGLPAVFRPGGSVTAGNSSPLNDGAAALLLASPEQARRLGLRPLARVVGGAAAGVDPRYMGIGPVPAIRKVLGRAGWHLGDVDRCELNEAFAVQVLAVLRELQESDEGDLHVGRERATDSGLRGEGWARWVDERVNVNGGAIALGHPLGCSGARIVTSLVHELQRGGLRRGLAAMCVGVGQGVAGIFERVEG